MKLEGSLFRRVGWGKRRWARRRGAMLYLICLFVLIFLGIGAWHDLGLDVVATGVALLVLGEVACSYLGLTITRSLGWIESALCIVTLIVLTLAALAIARGNLVLAVELEVLLAVLAALFRLLAVARWKRLDWMLCRPA